MKFLGRAPHKESEGAVKLVAEEGATQFVSARTLAPRSLRLLICATLSTCRPIAAEASRLATDTLPEEPLIGSPPASACYTPPSASASTRVSRFVAAAEDLWHAFNLIREGDTVTATTFRKIQRDLGAGSESEKVKLRLSVEVETVDFDPDGAAPTRTRSPTAIKFADAACLPWLQIRLIHTMSI